MAKHGLAGFSKKAVKTMKLIFLKKEGTFWRMAETFFIGNLCILKPQTKDQLIELPNSLLMTLCAKEC